MPFEETSACGGRRCTILRETTPGLKKSCASLIDKPEQAAVTWTNKSGWIALGQIAAFQHCPKGCGLILSTCQKDDVTSVIEYPRGKCYTKGVKFLYSLSSHQALSLCTDTLRWRTSRECPRNKFPL